MAKFFGSHRGVSRTSKRIDSIDGFSIKDIACFDKEKIKKFDTTYTKYLKYSWFIANALGASEIVWNLQKKDSAWGNTLKEVIGNYKIFYQIPVFDSNSYTYEMKKLIKQSIMYKDSIDKFRNDCK